MDHERLFFQVAGKFSVTSDVPEVVSLLGSCPEPVPTLSPVAIMSGSESLPPGTLVFRYPAQASLAARHIGIPMPATGEDGEPLVVPSESPPVASSITATQLRLWLFRRGVSDSEVSLAISAIPDETLRGEAVIQWSHSPYFERSHPLVEAVGRGLGLESAEIDAAFVEASRM